MAVDDDDWETGDESEEKPEDEKVSNEAFRNAASGFAENKDAKKPAKSEPIVTQSPEAKAAAIKALEELKKSREAAAKAEQPQATTTTENKPAEPSTPVQGSAPQPPLPPPLPTASSKKPAQPAKPVADTPKPVADTPKPATAASVAGVDMAALMAARRRSMTDDDEDEPPAKKAKTEADPIVTQSADAKAAAKAAAEAVAKKSRSEGAAVQDNKTASTAAESAPPPTPASDAAKAAVAAKLGNADGWEARNNGQVVSPLMDEKAAKEQAAALGSGAEVFESRTEIGKYRVGVKESNLELEAKLQEKIKEQKAVNAIPEDDFRKQYATQIASAKDNYTTIIDSAHRHEPDLSRAEVAEHEMQQASELATGDPVKDRIAELARIDAKKSTAKADSSTPTSSEPTDSAPSVVTQEATSNSTEKSKTNASDQSGSSGPQVKGANESEDEFIARILREKEEWDKQIEVENARLKASSELQDQSSLSEPAGNRDNQNTSEPVLTANAPDKPKPKEDAFSKAFAELEKQKAKGDDANQDHVSQIEKQLKEIQNSDEKPKHKEAKMMSYLKEEARDGKEVAQAVLKGVDEKAAKEVVPKTAVEKATEKHGLSDTQQANLAAFNKQFDQKARNQRNEDKGEAANSKSLKTLYKDNMKRVGNNLANQKVAEDENEAFAQLLMLLFELLAMPSGPMGAKLMNMAMQKFYENKADKYNDPSEQGKLLDNLEKTVGKLEAKIAKDEAKLKDLDPTSREAKNLNKEIKLNKAKLDVANGLVTESKKHLGEVQDNDLKERKQNLIDDRKKLTDLPERTDKQQKKLDGINKEIDNIERQQEQRKANPKEPIRDQSSKDQTVSLGTLKPEATPSEPVLSASSDTPKANADSQRQADSEDDDNPELDSPKGDKTTDPDDGSEGPVDDAGEVANENEEILAQSDAKKPDAKAKDEAVLKATPKEPSLIEKVSKDNNLTAEQTARLEERQKKTTGFFRGDDHEGKQKKYEDKADKANVDKLGDIYKKHGKQFLKDFGKNPLGKDENGNADPNKVAKDEYEAFAQLLLMIMQAIALLLSPLAEKGKNAIKEALYEKIAKDQGEKHNDPVVQRNFLNNLEKDIDKTERNIHNLKQRQANHKPDSRKYNQLQGEINYNQAKLDVLNHTKNKTDAHLKNLQKNFLDQKEKQLKQQIDTLKAKADKEPDEAVKGKLQKQIENKQNQLIDVRAKQTKLKDPASKAIREPKPDVAEKRVNNLEKREKAIEKAIDRRQQKLDKADPEGNKHKVLAKQQENTKKYLEKTQKALEDRTWQLQASLEREKKQLDEQKDNKRTPAEDQKYNDAVQKNADRQAETRQKLLEMEAKKTQNSPNAPTNDQQVTLGTPAPQGGSLSDTAGNKPSPTASGPTSPGTGSDAEAERIRRERDEADKRTEAENARLQATAAENDAASQRVTEAQNAANKTHDDLHKAKNEGTELEKERDKKSEAVNDAQTEKDKADKALEADKNNPTLKNDAESAKKKLDDAQNELNDANKKLEDNKKEVDRLKEADDKAQQNVQDVQKQNDADYAKNATGANATATATPTAANKPEDDTQAKIKADEETKRKADEEAQRQAEEDARLQAEEDARLQAEEDARLQAEEDARLQAEEEAKLQANEQAELQAEENNQLTQDVQAAAATNTNDDEANKDKEAERIEQDEEQGAELSTADQKDDDNDPNSPAAERKRAANQGAVTASPTDDTANDQEQAQSLGASGGASANADESEAQAAQADEQADNDAEASADADEEVDNDAQLQQSLDQGNDNDGLAAQADSPAPTTPANDSNDVDSPSPAALTQDDEQETELTQGSDQEASNDDTPAPTVASDDEESELKQGMDSPSPMSAIKGGDDEEEPEEPQADASASADEEESELKQGMDSPSPMGGDSPASASPMGGDSPASASPMSASPMGGGGGDSPASASPMDSGGESPMSSMSASPMGGGEGGPGGGMPSMGGDEGGPGGGMPSMGGGEEGGDEKQQMAMSAGAAAMGAPGGGEMAASGGGAPDIGGGGGGGMPSLGGGGSEEAPKSKGGEESKDDKKPKKGGGEETEDNSEYGPVSKVMAETVKMITDVLNEAVSNVIGGMGGGPGGGEDKKDGPKEGNGKSAPKKEGGGKGGKESKEGGDPSDAMGGAKEFTKGLVKLTGAIGSFAESMSDGKGADQTKAFEESLKMLSELFKGMGKVVKGGMEGGGMDGASPSGGGGKPGMDGASPGGGGKDKGGKEEKEPPSKNQQMATMAGDVGAQCMGIPPPASTMIGQAVGEAVGKIEKAMDIGKGFADFCNTLAEGCNVTSSKPNPGDVAMQKAESDSAAVLPAATKSLGETPGLKEQAKGPGAGAGAGADAGAAPPSSTPPPTPKSP